MEKIKKRSMSMFVLSAFLNLGIGYAFGLIVGVIVTILNHGTGAVYSMLVLPLQIAGGVFLLSQNMYRLYFYYRLSLDVNEVCKGDGMESDSYLSALILGILTMGLYLVYWKYKLAQRMRANAPRYGFKMLETGKEIAILGVFSFGYIAAWELIKNMNRIAKVYNEVGVPATVGGVQ